MGFEIAVSLLTSVFSLLGMVAIAVKLHRKFMDSLSRWDGRDASPGFPRVPGIPERVEITETTTREIKDKVDAAEMSIARIEAEQKDQAVLIREIHHEIRTNSGSSLKDAVLETKKSVHSLESRMASSESDRNQLHDNDATLLEGQQRIVDRLDTVYLKLYENTSPDSERG